VTRAFGRLVSPVDSRDRTYPLLAAQRTPPPRKTWRFPHPVLDQGDRPQCVAYAWCAMLLASPITGALPEPETMFAASLYQEAQRLDDMPGEAYEGTTVRGAAKALKARGLIASYRWAYTAADVVDFVLSTGPVVIGVDWSEAMSEPVRGDWIKPGGASLGGHAVLVIGADARGKRVRILNSWGASWGDDGRVWLATQDLDALLAKGGEACSAVEAPR
jgi:hypothetical protein